MIMRTTFLTAGLIIGAAVFYAPNVFSQTQSTTTITTKSASDTRGYISSGGFRNYEIGNTDDNIEDILQLIYNEKGEIFGGNVTLYTDDHTFTGTVLQVTNRYIVMLDQTQIGPRTNRVNAMHVIERGKVIGVTAQVLPE